MPNDDPDAFYYTPSELNSGGTKTIHFENREIASIETMDGQLLSDGSAWCVAVFPNCDFPVLGFFVPWGAIRAIGWVGTGFSQPTT